MVFLHTWYWKAYPVDVLAYPEHRWTKKSKWFAERTPAVLHVYPKIFLSENSKLKLWKR